MTLLAVFAPEINAIEKVVDYYVHIMIALLLIGFSALFTDYKKLMAVSLGCCMVLCLFLKNASNDNLVLPVANREAKLSVAHFNVSNIQDLENFFQIIHEIDVDLLSFQELTPDWNNLLQDSLKKSYPYNMSIVRIDPYGMALYCKDGFATMDTFLYDGKPNLDAKLIIEDKPINVIGSYLIPSTSKLNMDQITRHLDLISYKIREKNSPVIALGDYNLVYWANPISRFREQAQVIHSRRDIAESGLKPPYDHIFFSTDLECTKFTNIEDLEQNHIGILGAYQVKSDINLDPKPKTVLSSLNK